MDNGNTIGTYRNSALGIDLDHGSDIQADTSIGPQPDVVHPVNTAGDFTRRMPIKMNIDSKPLLGHSLCLRGCHSRKFRYRQPS